MKLADQIFMRRAPSASPEWLGDLFARLIWLLDDNGAEICESMREWIASGDLERARIALAMDEVFFYPTREEMVHSFASLCIRFPALKDRCDAIVAAWDAQESNQS